MTNQLQTFDFEDHQIQSFNINNELFLRAIQLAEILGYKNPRQALATHVDKEDVQKLDSLTKGGKQKVLYVNESGMYALILGSTLETAKRFKKWVTSEVLPSIRKTGSYTLTINEEQQYLISKAVDDRVYRTGEKHQTIYHKFYDRFRITSYKNLPASKFNEAIEFLGGVSIQTKLSDDDWYHLAWLYKAADRMRYQMELIEPALNIIGSSYRGAFYSMSRDYKYTLRCAKEIIERETNHIEPKNIIDKWNQVLNVIRDKPKSKVITFATDVDYLN